MFSKCFQHTALVAIPSLFVFLSALVLMFKLTRKKEGCKVEPLPWTLLLSAKFVSAQEGLIACHAVI